MHTSRGKTFRRQPSPSSRGEVFHITTASDSLAADQAKRAKKYLIKTAIRLVCIALACVTHGLFMWFFIISAAVLPYAAVIGANLGRERNSLSMAPISFAALPASTSLIDSDPPA